MPRVLALVGATAAVALAVAGCDGTGGGGGGAPQPKPVSKQELRAMLERADREISQSFERVEQASRKGNSEQLKRALNEAAATEERQITRLQRVRPPKEAEKPLNELLEGARGQVKELRQLAQRGRLDKEVLENELMKPGKADEQVERGLRELSKKGFAPPVE